VSAPLTRPELDALAARYLRGEATEADISAALDVTRWFEGCAVDDLSGIQIEKLVRAILRRYMRHEMLSALRQANGASLDNMPEVLYPSMQDATDEARAVRSLLDELRLNNKLEESP
jgi:hypothetical protein